MAIQEIGKSTTNSPQAGHDKDWTFLLSLDFTFVKQISKLCVCQQSPKSFYLEERSYDSFSPRGSSTVELLEGKVLEEDVREVEFIVFTEPSAGGKNQIDHAAD
jgi:hypothetical protein